jgi:hypothetical protein
MEVLLNGTARRVSYGFLCALPFLDFVAAGARPLRTPPLHQVLGAILFAAAAAAAWVLGARRIVSGAGPGKGLALAGTLLLTPWAVVSLLWIGIGAPFQATPPENRMRFLVLLANSIVVTAGFIALKEELGEARERFFSTLGVTAAIAAGTAYLGCMSLISASYIAKLRAGQAPPMGLLSDVFDVLEFFACTLTYLATAAFAASLGRIG